AFHVTGVQTCALPIFSGRQSSPHLTLVPSFDPDEPPLEFAWRFYGADHEVVSGGPSSRDLTVVAAGDQPLHAELTVRNGSGGSQIGRAACRGRGDGGV